MRILSAVVCMLLMLQFLATKEAKSQDIPEDTLRMIKANKFSPETVRERFWDRLQEMARRERQHPKPPLISWSDDALRHKITHVEIPVRTEDDLARLRSLGIDCCPKIGWCECDMTLEQAAKLKEEGMNHRMVSNFALEERKGQWERMCQLVGRIDLGPDDVIVASVQVNKIHDLLFLQSIGMVCCQDTGKCECCITKEQWKHLGARRFAYQASVRDTTIWGKETKPNSRVEPPPKKL